MTLDEAKAFVLRVMKAARDDLDEPGWLAQSTVDRFAAELCSTLSVGAAHQEKKT